MFRRRREAKRLHPNMVECHVQVEPLGGGQALLRALSPPVVCMLAVSELVHLRRSNLARAQPNAETVMPAQIPGIGTKPGSALTCWSHVRMPG